MLRSWRGGVVAWWSRLGREEWRNLPFKKVLPFKIQKV